MRKTLALSLIFAFALFATGCTTPAATPVTTTPIPTAAPMATAPDNIAVTLYPGTPTAIVTITYAISGAITYNHAPTASYRVIIITDRGSQYGNVTDAGGRFSVTFPDDGSQTYRIELVDSGNSLVYRDSLPRYMNHTGPMSIDVEVPGPNQMSVSIA